MQWSDHSTVKSKSAVFIDKPMRGWKFCRSKKRFNSAAFMNDLEKIPILTLVQTFDDPSDQIIACQKLFCEILNTNTQYSIILNTNTQYCEILPLRKVYDREKHVPYLSKEWNIARIK